VLGLPIDALIPQILRSFERSPNLVVQAPPGSGKSTRIPPALLPLAQRQILVLEPRRIAARMVARRVAFEMGERLGDTVGYQVRFEESAGPKTRLRFLTEGILTRRLLSNPTLADVDVVILDEFHERHLDGDLALSLLRRLQQTTRPDLRIVVMSATLAAEPVARFLESPIVEGGGRSYPLDVRYTAYSADPLEDQAAKAVAILLEENRDGDILVFLPGAAEIRRTARAVESLAKAAELTVYPLHGDVPPEQQELAVRPAARRKVILSTNVAESSITIEGVRAVVDSGLARVAADSPWSGLPSLKVARVSRASCDQRAGRAGRTGRGTVVRLFTEEDYLRRPAQDAPEILRRELSEMCLALKAIGIGEPGQVAWIDPPPERAVEAAADLLSRLGAIDAGGSLTDTGRRLSRYPLHPRLGRILIEAAARGVAESGCRAAAVLSAGERLPAGIHETGTSDVLYLADHATSHAVKQNLEQIRRVAHPARQSSNDENAVLAAILTGFPDRVAKRRSGTELLLAGGGSARQAGESVVRSARFLVAVDVDDRREHGVPLVRQASAIEADWLLDYYPDRITERTSVEWNRTAERVESVSAILYDSLVLEESREGVPDAEQASELLASKAMERGLAHFVETEEVDRFLARLRFASVYSGLPVFGEGEVDTALRSVCRGLRSFAELQKAGKAGALFRALEGLLPPHGRRVLEETAPQRIALPSGRQAPVNYAKDQAPWVTSRLQDFFGMRETPRVAGGKVPLVVHLLAPNGRPVQMTTDLEGFWQRLYPQVRRELMRRYPKHKWPEKPV
jgi:ATP-dependent helicase HrpB